MVFIILCKYGLENKISNTGKEQSTRHMHTS